MQTSLVPSLPAKDWSSLENLLENLSGVSMGFQVDLVDGLFVDAISWPFNTNSILTELAKLSRFKDIYELEFDCMVCDPVKYMDTLVAVGASRIIVHYNGVEDWSKVFSHKNRHGYLLGLGFTNDVDLSAVHKLINHFDYIQVMGIAEVGKQGQPFDERTLETIVTLRSAYPDLEIAVDGSVNKETIPLLLEVGANRFAPGSAIAKDPDPVSAYKQLLSLTS